MQNALLDVGPEFVPPIAGHATQKAPAGAIQGVLGIVLACGTPGIRNEIAAGDSRIASEGKLVGAVTAPSKESLLHDVAHTMPKGNIRVAKIARIFSPEGAQSCLDAVAERDTTFRYSEALSES